MQKPDPTLRPPLNVRRYKRVPSSADRIRPKSGDRGNVQDPSNCEFPVRVRPVTCCRRDEVAKEVGARFTPKKPTGYFVGGVEELNVLIRILAMVVGLLALPGLAFAQRTDYSAGKTPAQLFSGDCSACHKTPRGLAKQRDSRALTSFLREHYTTKVESAGALAAYLLGNPSGPAPEAKKKQGVADGDNENNDIVVPEGERRSATQEAAKPRKGKKLTPAELAREAAKAAEDAKAKVQAYANTGEPARPIEPEPVAQPAAVTPPPAEAASPPPAEAASPQSAEPATPQTPAENSTPQPAPAAESKSPAEEKPAAAPPG